MTSMRERIQNLPPVVSYGVVTVIVLGAVVSIVMKGRNDQSLPPAIAERMVYRQCAGCGHIEENKFAELVEKRWIAADQALGPRGEGARCPQCQRDQMIFVLKCPSDGAVFNYYGELHRGYEDTPDASVCPKCQWNPFVVEPARQEQA